MYNKNTNSKKHYGFTIVELLVVIVVIGILAAITIVSYTGITHKADEATLKSDLTNNAKKLGMYYTQYGEYPHIDAGTGCPVAPSTLDSNYCLKFSPSNTFVYTYKTATTYDLTATRGDTTYRVTENTSPTLSIISDPDWVAIGTQVWAKNNLNVGVFITSTVAEANDSIVEKYCYEDIESNCTSYGALYKWNEAMNYSTSEGAQGICPVNSHIPSDNDWKILEMSLGMSQATADSTGLRGTNEGKRLVSGGDSGLNIPLAGYRSDDNDNGLFGGMPWAAYLWSSTELVAQRAFYSDDVMSTYRGDSAAEKSYISSSVRCIKN